MLNQTLKNEIAPWQEKGKWYHFLLESNGTNHTITVADINDCSVSATSLIFPANFNLVDVKIIKFALNTGKNYTDFGRSNQSGKTALTIPNAAYYSHMEFYVFGYFD